MASRNHHFSFAAASARYDAWWQGQRLDRPPVSIWVEPRHPASMPRSNHATLRDRWMDAKFQVESAYVHLDHNPTYADNVPSYFPNVGPDLVSTLFGAELVFGESTSWCQHTIHDISDWERFIATPPDFDNPYWQAIEQMITLAADRFGGRFYVAMPDLHGNYDILAGIRGPEDLCLDLIDDPDLVRRACAHASRAYAEAFKRMHQRLTSLGQPSTTWCSYLHNGPAYVPSCDFLCLVSKDIGEDFIRPAVEQEMAQLDRSIFHLDGPQALHHLDMVLRLPRLNAVQWVFGAGHGRASDWLHVYRTCREAGKALQILAEDAADALHVLRELGPDGLWLTLGSPFKNASQATAFLDEVHALSS